MFGMKKIEKILQTRIFENKLFPIGKAQLGHAATFGVKISRFDS